MVNSTPLLGKFRERERERKRRERETRKNESRTREEKKSLSVEDARRRARRVVVVVAGDVKRKKDTQKRINLYDVFLFCARACVWSILTVDFFFFVFFASKNECCVKNFVSFRLNIGLTKDREDFFTFCASSSLLSLQRKKRRRSLHTHAERRETRDSTFKRV